jgi:hypothetical protein
METATPEIEEINTACTTPQELFKSEEFLK